VVGLFSFNIMYHSDSIRFLVRWDYVFPRDSICVVNLIKLVSLFLVNSGAHSVVSSLVAS
jgi:hypothetical protein